MKKFYNNLSQFFLTSRFALGKVFDKNLHASEASAIRPKKSFFYKKPIKWLLLGIIF